VSVPHRPGFSWAAARSIATASAAQLGYRQPAILREPAATASNPINASRTAEACTAAVLAMTDATRTMPAGTHVAAASRCPPRTARSEATRAHRRAKGESHEQVKECVLS